MKHLLLFFSIIILFVSQTFATHNRAGEITFRQDSLLLLRYHITIVTYTKTSSIADRPTLPMSWGDGTNDTLPRANGNGDPVPGSTDIQVNYYYGTHDYPGPGTYFISFEDPNRNAGVVNIPNSVSIPFYIETMLIINPFIGTNSSPVLLEPPIDEACVNKLFIHNPNAFDPDGDSLSYILLANKGAGGVVIPGYTIPPASNSISLDPLTGDFIWETPTMQGEFNIAILIEEWRNGTRIGYVTRDMQINVNAVCQNNPPVFDPLPDFCVEAGTTIQFNVTANDPPPVNIVTLSATGAPFAPPLGNTITNPAFFQGVSGTGSVTGTFMWNTHCVHVRKQPYQVLFKAKDNGTVKLADLERVNITVVSPSPKNPAANPLGSNIELTWDASICTGVLGYDIYRRGGFFGFVPSQCETGVPAYTGYTKIATVNGLFNTTYSDNNNGAGLSPGIEYCYMIVSVFPDGAESYASVEVCAELKKDIPVITNVSIASTDVNTGEVYVAGSKPSE
ncbi:MAG: gliding motility-associated C-terminal domain-containing protein, partial [Bacteroidia bacterium]